MEVIELNILNAAKCEDFVIKEVVGSGSSGLVVAAHCTREGLPDPNKVYAVKLLYNFCHEQSSVVRNVYENEWLLLSRILPHPNVIRFWAQFVDVIGDNFAQHLPDHIRNQALHSDPRGRGKLIRRKAQFVILDFHARTMRENADKQASVLPYDIARKYALELLEGTCYLYEHGIVHLDLKLDNILLSTDDHLVICDFGHANQLPPNSYSIRIRKETGPGGNQAHLSPEILSAYHKLRMDPSAVEAEIDYSKQAAWAIGCLIYEMVEGSHPLPDYPLGYGEPDHIEYSMNQLPHLPSHYPSIFRSSVSKLLHPDPSQRMSLAEARSVIKGDRYSAMHGQDIAVESLKQRLELVLRERDMLVSQLKSERDGAIQELQAMAEQCKSVASEFEAMADQCEQAIADKEVLAREKEEAVKASMAAIEVNSKLEEQLVSVSAERDLFRSQVDDLKRRSIITFPGVLRECTNCHKFYLDSENKASPCQWHPGRHIFNRWSCCYEQDMNASGCYQGAHSPLVLSGKECKPSPVMTSVSKKKVKGTGTL